MSNTLQSIVDTLNDASTSEGLSIEAVVINEEEMMARVLVETREEFPIIVDVDDDQVVAIVNLFDASELREGVEAEMMGAMLSMNIAMPLSSFAKTGNQYQLFGALSVDSKQEVFVEEIDALSGNMESVIDSFTAYLK